jgi:hypothetical protein
VHRIESGPSVVHCDNGRTYEIVEPPPAYAIGTSHVLVRDGRAMCAQVTAAGD